MRIVQRRNGLAGLLAGLAFFCVALPARAQDARLKLDHLEKLSAKAVEVNNVTLDGSPYPTDWLPITKLHTGTAQLEFTTQSQPEMKRGTKVEDRPPSFR